MKYFPSTIQLMILLFLPTLFANSANQELKVGFQIKPPFVIKDNNQYSGVCIDLWEKVADSLNIKYSYKEYEMSELLHLVENGGINIAISPLTVTASRIQKFGFTQPYYITNLAFATKVEKSNDIIAFVSDLFSVNFLKAFIPLFLIILIFGMIVWFLEKKSNPEQFRKGIDGIGDGIWWSATTMSTVGYGDKAPTTTWGRILGMIWMFTAVIVISGLTASVSSSLTVHNLKSEVSNFEDLRKIKVGCVSGTGTAEFLEHYKVRYTNYNDVEDGLKAVNDGTIKAFVYDDAILNYYVQTSSYDEVIKVIPSSYFKEYFSFASNDNELLKEISEVLIGIIESDEWEADLEKYHIEYRN